MIGLQIGQYRIIRKIGQGGMGVVYEAQHDSLPLRKAVKVLYLAYAQDSAESKRFHREAQAASRVRHPGLVEVFDFGQLPDGTVFMMMEFLEGETLRERLQQVGGTLPMSQALDIIRQITAALIVVHEAQIVHRDLTPANIMLVADADDATRERVKILDFGIAKLLGEQSAQTEPGRTLGTPRYMSPEQCQGQPVDGRSDVYSLGVLLFEILTGEWPYAGVEFGTEVIWRAHLTARPRSLREFLPEAPDSLISLCRELLARQPAARPSLHEVRERLAQWALPEAPPRPSAPAAVRRPAAPAPDTDTGPAAAAPDLRSETAARPRRLRRLLAAGLCASLLLIIGVSWLVRRSRSQPASLPPITGMVAFERSRFFMGSTREEIDSAAEAARHLEPELVADYFDREQPRQPVRLSPFYLDAREVTNEEYAYFLNASGPFQTDRDAQGISSLRYGDRRIIEVDRGPNPDQPGLAFQDGLARARPGHERRPVVYITWHGADLYCHHQGKHLPTEAQWEFAARGGGAHAYPWGEALPQCGRVAFGHKTGGPCAPALLLPPEVATHPMDHTAQGVFDLGGSVEEWVLDRFVHGYQQCEDCEDPIATGSADIRSTDPRVQRGGNFRDNRLYLRAAGRSRMGPDQTDGDVGFRCAKTVSR